MSFWLIYIKVFIYSSFYVCCILMNCTLYMYCILYSLQCEIRTYDTWNCALLKIFIHNTFWALENAHIALQAFNLRHLAKSNTHSTDIQIYLVAKIIKDHHLIKAGIRECRRKAQDRSEWADVIRETKFKL